MTKILAVALLLLSLASATFAEGPGDGPPPIQNTGALL